MKLHNSGGSCKIPCFSCAFPGFPYQPVLTKNKKQQSLVLAKGNYCRNVMRHAACAYYDDHRYKANHDVGSDDDASNHPGCIPGSLSSSRTMHEKRQKTASSRSSLTIASPNNVGQEPGASTLTDQDQREGMLTDGESSPHMSPHHGSSPHTPARTLPYAGRLRNKESEASLLVTKTVFLLQTVFRSELPGHIPVQESYANDVCHNLFFVLPTVVAQRDHRQVDELSFNLDARRPVYLQLLTRGTSPTLKSASRTSSEVYFVCSVHTVPGLGLPQQIPGLGPVIHDPECKHPCTCWEALFLYCSSVMRLSDEISTYDKIASTLKHHATPWVLRHQEPGDMEGPTSIRHRVWEPPRPQHAFNVFMVFSTPLCFNALLPDLLACTIAISKLTLGRSWTGWRFRYPKLWSGSRIGAHTLRMHHLQLVLGQIWFEETEHQLCTL